jgi:hypothetical protein
LRNKHSGWNLGKQARTSKPPEQTENIEPSLCFARDGKYFWAKFSVVACFSRFGRGGRKGGGRWDRLGGEATEAEEEALTEAEEEEEYSLLPPPQRSLEGSLLPSASLSAGDKLFNLVVVYYCRTYYKAVRVGGGGQWRTCAMRYDKLRLVWTSLPITH